MFEAVKKYSTFTDQTNPLTKIMLAVILFVTVIFIHNPNTLFYLMIFMLFLLIVLSGIQYKYLIILLLFIFISGLISSMYMIFYGEALAHRRISATALRLVLLFLLSPHHHAP